jgi:hypothetical protein
MVSSPALPLSLFVLAAVHDTWSPCCTLYAESVTLIGDVVVLWPGVYIIRASGFEASVKCALHVGGI